MGAEGEASVAEGEASAAEGEASAIANEIAVSRNPKSMPTMPVIAIVGRPNVGKSSLLNALAGRRISIVQDLPGVTRDRVSYPLDVDGRFVELVDTGGYGFVDPNQLTEHIQHQIELAMAQANLVLLLVDCQAGLTGGDEQIAALLRRRGIKTLLVANKADGPKADAALGDFARLGFGTPIGVSALNVRNLDQLLAAIRQNVDLSHAPTELPAPQMMLAIVGKRNAGKSTLVNSIAQLYEGDPQRVIVSEIPGTTRDSIDVRFEKEGKTLIVIDTAGVRKKRRMATNDIEFYSFHRAQRSIRRADVVVMLIDGPEPVSDPDKKLSQYLAEQFKPVLLVINKWDLTLQKLRENRKDIADGSVDESQIMQEFREYLDQELKQIDYAPIAFITAKDGRNIQIVIDAAQHLFKQANTRLTTGQLNRVVRQILQEKHPSTPSGRKARIYYATQSAVAPPTIVLFVNNPKFLDEAYQRFMINRFRELLPYPEVPIRLVIRGRQSRKPAPSLDEASDDQIEKLS
ncbi:MAG: ribosome biogenesis GTPase Der [Tepidisphaeraceae bacterium]|jgi:GTP-binding protein